MLIKFIIIVPFVFGLVSFFINNDFWRRALIVVCSAIHFFLTGLAWLNRPDSGLGDWFFLDNLGVIFLTITSFLFLGASIYGIVYLADEKRKFDDEGKNFSREAIFSGCFLLFLSTMTIVTVSQHLAVLWAAIEATTLASAPLIYFHRTKRSLEATWKYLLICSVGIALALLGLFFLSVSNGSNQGNLVLSNMIQTPQGMNIVWLKAAFLLLFVGYGTKMGLAPFHTWLPDAHSEAPSVVSALLSGALLNCALLGILRAYQVCLAAGLGSYCRDIFISFGLLSILFAAIFILGQKDYKRMLAYSSVEHMGIITLGIGLGGQAVYGSLISVIGHSLGKAGLFFVAGNIFAYSKTKTISEIQGLINGRTYYLGLFWMVGFLLITATPPSAIFLGKFVILKEIIFQGRYWIVVIFLTALALVFIGMARIFLSMTEGVTDNKNPNYSFGLRFFVQILPTTVFFGLIIAIGLYFPAGLKQQLETAAKMLGGF